MFFVLRPLLFLLLFLRFPFFSHDALHPILLTRIDNNKSDHFANANLTFDFAHHRLAFLIIRTLLRTGALGRRCLGAMRLHGPFLGRGRPPSKKGAPENQCLGRRGRHCEGEKMSCEESEPVAMRRSGCSLLIDVVKEEYPERFFEGFYDVFMQIAHC